MLLDDIIVLLDLLVFLLTLPLHLVSLPTASAAAINLAIFPSAAVFVCLSLSLAMVLHRKWPNAGLCLLPLCFMCESVITKTRGASI